MSGVEAGRKYRSIFSPSTSRERVKNFESYWVYTQNHDGEILEDQKDLTIKRGILARFRQERVEPRHPLPDPARFYRNYLHLKDDPRSFDQKTLLLTCLYKFARHEWVGISAAWETIPSIAQARTVTEKISRYHLCEEFCHVRLFHEMFRTYRLDDVQWVPLNRWVRGTYKILSILPERLMSVPAFLTELMGITFYMHVDRLLDEIFADEPEVRDRIRELLHEIMIDELAHIGQRRNFIGSFGIRLARWIFPPLMRVFFRDIPEAKHLLNVKQMIRDGLAFDYSKVSPKLLERSWVPTYCQV